MCVCAMVNTVPQVGRFGGEGTMLGHVRIAACVIAFPENARFDVFTD